MVQNIWTAISNTFEPFDPVPASKLDEWFVTRPDSPIGTLVRQPSPERLPQRHILVGQPASGKSSELTKLASELKKRYAALVVRFDMTDNTDVERANPVEVIFLMGAALFKVAVAELPENRHPDPQLLDNLKSGLETLVQKHTQNKEFKVEGMVDALNAIIDDVRLKANRPLVFLVDGLDKLRDSNVISLNFLEKKFLHGPRCSVLYTGPLDLYSSPQFGEVRARFPIVPFPHVKLHDRENPDQLDKLGYQVMRDVVRRRLESLGFKLQEAITHMALNMLIKGSGGVMRDFIRLVQSAALQAEIVGKAHIGKPEASKAMNDLRRQLMAQLTPDYHAVLNKVRQTHQRVGEEDAEKCDLLLRNDIVLSLDCCDLGWSHMVIWEPCPAAWQIPGQRHGQPWRPGTTGHGRTPRDSESAHAPVADRHPQWCG